MSEELLTIAKQVALKHKGNAQSIVSIGTDGSNMWVNFHLSIGQGQYPVSSVADAIEKLNTLLKKN